MRLHSDILVSGTAAATLRLCDTGSSAAGVTAAGKSRGSIDGEEDEESSFVSGSQAASQSLSKQSSTGTQSSSSDIAGPVVKGASSMQAFVVRSAELM